MDVDPESAIVIVVLEVVPIAAVQISTLTPVVAPLIKAFWTQTLLLSSVTPPAFTVTVVLPSTTNTTPVCPDVREIAASARELADAEFFAFPEVAETAIDYLNRSAYQ
jgi:hypothetical protein